MLIYWHVDKKSVAINSQLISCTASEVAAMIDGAMHHRTEMDVQANYVDSHGQSEVGFGLTRLLGFELKPRLKRINVTKLYLPDTDIRPRIPDLLPVLSKQGPIRWELIAQQYDQLIKYATAINNRTASTEAILRRFTRAATHPTYQAMLEVGRAQRTIFLCRYLRSRDEQREVNAGLNVVESWNGANTQIHYGKAGDIASNRRDEQEMTALCLHIVQAAMVYVNTLMIQDILAEDDWAELFTPEDLPRTHPADLGPRRHARRVQTQHDHPAHPRAPDRPLTRGLSQTDVCDRPPQRSNRPGRSTLAHSTKRHHIINASQPDPTDAIRWTPALWATRSATPESAPPTKTRGCNSTHSRPPVA